MLRHVRHVSKMQGVWTYLPPSLPIVNSAMLFMGLDMMNTEYQIIKK